MNYQEAMERFERLLPYVSELMDDDILRKEASNAKVNNLTIGEAFLKFFPLFFVNHREAVLGVVAVTLGKTTEEVREMPFEEAKVAFELPLVKDFFTLLPFVFLMVGKL